MKKSIACGACRESKRRCMHRGGPPCDRCQERGDECVFPPRGTSHMFRGRQKLSRRSQHSTDSSEASNVTSATIQETVDPTLLADPFTYMTDEIKESFLRCSYKWSFYHIATFLKEVQDQSLDPALAWAILAISVRFSQNPPHGFSSQVHASNAFASQARSLILLAIDEPTLSRIQVLLLLTGHSWGAGDGKRAWVYLGMAIRMAQVMGMFEESMSTTTREGFILAESRRRTAWTCFLMDSLLSGGKSRNRALSAEDMRVQLPCDSEHFNFGEPVRCEMLDGSIHAEGLDPVGSLGIISFSMRVADIWGAVARWACSSAPDHLAPWDPESEIQKLFSRLENWKTSLPPRLRYDKFLLHAHTVANQGQAYCYMHSIYFMSVMFLYRSYLPEVEMEPPRPRNPEFAQWSFWSSGELIKVAQDVCDMLQEIRGFGLFFLRGLVPWIGFTIYTAIGVLLYFVYFPRANTSGDEVSNWRRCTIEGCQFLKHMKQAWPMADTWHRTILRMQIFYGNIKAQGSRAMSPSERREMRNALVDYGALQPSSSRKPENELPSQNEPPEDENSDCGRHPQQANMTEVSEPEILENYFELDEYMRASIAEATQGFWESFPGFVAL